MSLHTFVRFEPQAGKDDRLREELRGVVEATRSEAGCLGIHLFESVRPPVVFFIHSEWVDEGAFDAHKDFPHMRNFLAVVPELVTHRVHAVRTECIS